ncbi:uncharacterized protein LOC141903492 [Tubulanus polymorphus]|uniref:uncharacterized protein LOC141903492 n=1 Tax=Tubulanus polymorphus TaxID=672921 RepID=UPI003DA4A779
MDLKNISTTFEPTVTTPGDWCAWTVKNRPFKWNLQFSVYMYIFCYGPVTILGIALNVVTILVLKKMNNEAYYLIQVLAIFDLSYSLSVFTMYPLRTLHIYIHLGEVLFRIDDWYYGWEFIQVALGPYRMFQQIRNWCVILISLERLVVTIFPLKSRLFWTRKVVNSLIFLITAYGVLVYLPHLVPERGLEPVGCIEGGPGVTLVRGSNLINSALIGRWNDFAEGWEGTISSIVVPMCSLIVLNIILVISLIIIKLSSGKKLNKSAASSLELRVLRMSLALVASYIICESSIFIEKMGYYNKFEIKIHFPGLNSEASYLIYRKLAIVLTVVDSCLNFFVYCFTNNKFRLAVKILSIKSTLG